MHTSPELWHVIVIVFNFKMISWSSGSIDNSEMLDRQIGHVFSLLSQSRIERWSKIWSQDVMTGWNIMSCEIRQCKASANSSRQLDSGKYIEYVSCSSSATQRDNKGSERRDHRGKSIKLNVFWENYCHNAKKVILLERMVKL